MAQRNLIALKVYVDRDVARKARLAAAAEGGNISSFLRLTLEQRLGLVKRPDRTERMVEYAIRGINKLLDDRDPGYRQTIKSLHDKRYPGQSDAD